jgi:MFS family permease
MRANSYAGQTLPMRLSRALEPLAHRDFRLLWTGQAISLLGNFVHGVALPFQILALGGGPLELGLWGVIFSLAALVIVLLAGVAADRFPRRRVILASDLAAGLVVTWIAALAALGELRIEHLYVEAAIFGATESFLHPALSALIPELVPADILQAGNALRGTSRQIALLGGPVAGGLLVAVGGPPLAFGADAATFFASFVALAFAASPKREPPAPAPLLRQVRDGLAYTFSVPWLWIFIFAWTLVLFGQVGPLNVGLPIFVRDVLHGDAQLFGLVLAAVGIGEVVTGLALAQLKVRRLGIGICVFGVAGGLALAGVGLWPEIGPTLVFVAIFGAQFVGVGVLWTTALQKHVPQHLLGRVLSIDQFGGSLLLPLAPLVFAAVITAVGPSEAFLIGGLFSAVISGLLLLVPEIRSLE